MASGITQELTNVAAKQFLIVKEPLRLSADYLPVSNEFYLTVNGGKGLGYSLESSTDPVTWTTAATLTNQNGTVVSTNPISASGKNTFFRIRE